MKTKQENITELSNNQIFVFGSNLSGNHIGGAALFAKQNFSAIEGVGEGMNGQCYSFPTLDKNMQKVSVEALKESRNRLYSCAKENPDLQFLVTKLGCGIAGFSETEISNIFKGNRPSNLIFPINW